MFCPKCGAENSNLTMFCTACGYRLPNIAPAGEGSRNIYEWTDDQNDHQPLYAEQPMKWWKFLVYFWLIATAVVDLIYGLVVMFGSHWWPNTSSMYAEYRGLRTVDIIYGIFMCGFSIWIILTRQSLYKFKEKGPKMLLITYVIDVVGGSLQYISYAVVLGFPAWTLVFGRSGLSICLEIAMIVVNKIYFDKRYSMFVN